MKPGKIEIWPDRIDRASAIEAVPTDAARILENLEMDQMGRLRRRRGLARVELEAIYPEQGTVSCGVFGRRDGAVLLIDAVDNGVVRLTVNPVTDSNDTLDFGAVGTVGNYENINEDGP